MRKAEELEKKYSCLNKAEPTEILFILLARDAAAPVAIRAWVAERIRLGKNDTAQLTEALQCADQMERQRGMMGRKP